MFLLVLSPDNSGPSWNPKGETTVLDTKYGATDLKTRLPNDKINDKRDIQGFLHFEEIFQTGGRQTESTMWQDFHQIPIVFYRYHSEFCSLTKQKTNLKETQNTTPLLFLLSHGDFQSVSGGLLLGMECGKENSCKGLHDQNAFQEIVGNTSDWTEERCFICIYVVIFNGQINILL